MGAVLVATCISAACASPPAPVPPATALPLTTTPTAPVASTGEPQAVEFESADGAALHGTFYGAGNTAIIFSEMGAQKQATWAAAAQAAAARGYLALTYDFRYWVSDNSIEDSLRDKAPEDLAAALAFVRSRGAGRVVLVGASLGALATIRVAASGGVTAVVILAAPLGPVSGLNLQVTPAEVQAISAPKLFIASEGDEAGFADDIQKMYDLAAGPKDLQFYPGRAHGTDLLTAASGQAVIQRILDFIETYAPLRAEPLLF